MRVSSRVVPMGPLHQAETGTGGLWEGGPVHPTTDNRASLCEGGGCLVLAVRLC